MAIPSKLFAVRCDDGSIAILTFILRSRGPAPWGATIDPLTDEWVRDASDANVFYEISRIYSSPDKPKPLGYRAIDESEIPTDRTFRDAWIDDGKTITYDMKKAREIQLSRIRFARGPKLDQLDREWMRATGQGDKAEAARIESEREALRNLPATIQAELDSAKNIEELKSKWSPILD